MSCNRCGGPITTAGCPKCYQLGTGNSDTLTIKTHHSGGFIDGKKFERGRLTEKSKKLIEVALTAAETLQGEGYIEQGVELKKSARDLRKALTGE